MDRVKRLARACLAAAAALALGAGLAGCGDDGDPPDDEVAEAPGAFPESPGDDPGDDVVDPHEQRGAEPDPGDLDLDPPEGYTAIPLPSLGIGLAVPDGWQAIMLTDEAIERVEELPIEDGFVGAARNAQRSGALLYAAGPDGEGGVADLKLQAVPRPAADAAAVAADALAAAPEGATLDDELGEDPPRLRIRFQVDGQGVEAEGTQWIVPGIPEVWSMIVTSEDAATHDELARSLLDTLALAPPR